MKTNTLFVKFLFVCFLSSHAYAENRLDTVQTPETLCKCFGNRSIPKNGIQTLDEFVAKFGAGFENHDELELAWRVYKAVNQCDAVVVLGRLSDTHSFENKAGYCVLRTLEGWTIRVNKAFVRGATDRGARIQLVSEMPTETMGRNGNIDMIGPEDRESNWIVIYNNEIQWVLATGNYNLANDWDKKITPDNPAYLQPDIISNNKTDKNDSANHVVSIAGTWSWAFAEIGEPKENGSVTFNADGTMTWSGGSYGTWKQSGKTVSLQWKDKPSADMMMLSEDGNTMEGVNNKGWKVKGRRY